jgi:cytochrome c oxidase cbb3-type subunit 3
MSQEKLQSQTVQTTGHAWDGDLQEFNNPLPTWWVYAFYVSVALSVLYWFIYPAWPVGKSHTTGFNTVTYTNNKGETVTSPWNTRAQLMADMNAAAELQKPYFAKIAATPYDKIAADAELAGFVRSAGKVLFADNCAACHQAGGQGVIGFFPNLTDDDWLYGGHFEQIQATLMQGRRGYMPAFREVLNDAQIDDLAAYVASLSAIKAARGDAVRGRALFGSETAACYYCHGADAHGRKDVGAPNLSDKIWLWADVPGQAGDEARFEVLRTVIAKGLNRGVMPAWEGRLNTDQIKVLTAYVHLLGGGQ